MSDLPPISLRSCPDDEELNNWWYSLSKASRILCLAEKHLILLMWAHYAKDHTGVAIKTDDKGREILFDLISFHPQNMTIGAVV